MEGRSLSDSMAKQPRIFSDLYVNMVRAGESSGALVEVLRRMADHFERFAQVQAKFSSALIYPAFVAWTLAESVKELNITYSSLWQELQLIVAATVAMGGAISLVQWAMPGVEVTERLVRVSMATGVGALVYWTGISWNGSRVSRDISEAASWLFKRRQSVLKGAQ